MYNTVNLLLSGIYGEWNAPDIWIYQMREGNFDINPILKWFSPFSSL
jgi:hypothetical protein